jgi:hypothetical protein
MCRAFGINMVEIFLEWILSFFKKEPKEAKEVIKRIKKNEEKLKEIENEESNIDDIIDRLNK